MEESPERLGAPVPDDDWAFAPLGTAFWRGVGGASCLSALEAKCLRVCSHEAGVSHARFPHVSLGVSKEERLLCV